MTFVWRPEGSTDPAMWISGGQAFLAYGIASREPWTWVVLACFWESKKASVLGAQWARRREAGDRSESSNRVLSRGEHGMTHVSTGSLCLVFREQTSVDTGRSVRRPWQQCRWKGYSGLGQDGCPIRLGVTWELGLNPLCSNPQLLAQCPPHNIAGTQRHWINDEPSCPNKKLELPKSSLSAFLGPDFAGFCFQ